MLKALVVAVTALALSACGGSTTATPLATSGETSDKATIVTTAYPLFEAASNIGGTRMHVDGPIAHAFDNATLTANQANKLRDADLAIVMGHGTQPAIEAVVNTRTKPTLRILDAISPNSSDPHVWLDPTNMGKIASAIRDSLVALDSAGQQTFEKRWMRYDKTIAAVDKLYAQRLAACDSRSLLVTEPNFGALAARYGLQQIAVGTNSDANHQSIGQAVEQYKAKAVYFPKIPALDDARALRAATGARAAQLDDLADRTDQARRGGASYSSVMRLDLDAITEGLGCADPSKS